MLYNSSYLIPILYSHEQLVLHTNRQISHETKCSWDDCFALAETFLVKCGTIIRVSYFIKKQDLSKPQGEKNGRQVFPAGLRIMPKLVDRIFSDGVIDLCDLYSIWF